jgi:hypothetical protein
VFAGLPNRDRHRDRLLHQRGSLGQRHAGSKVPPPGTVAACAHASHISGPANRPVGHHFSGMGRADGVPPNHREAGEFEQAYYRQDTLAAGAAAGTTRRALTRGGSRCHAGSGPVRHGLGMASTSQVWDLVRSRYSDSRERFREFRVRVRSAFAISAAAGFMNRIQPKSSPTAMW